MLVNLRAKFQLDNSKFAWIRQFWENFTEFQIWKNLITSIDFCRIRYQRSLIHILYCMCDDSSNFTTVTATTPIFQKIRNPIKPQIGHQLSWSVMKIFTIKMLQLLRWCTKFHIDISSHLWVIGLWNVENRTHMHTRKHTYIQMPAKNDLSR